MRQMVGESISPPHYRPHQAAPLRAITLSRFNFRGHCVARGDFEFHVADTIPSVHSIVPHRHTLIDGAR